MRCSTTFARVAPARCSASPQSCSLYLSSPSLRMLLFPQPSPTMSGLLGFRSYLCRYSLPRLLPGISTLKVSPGDVLHLPLSCINNHTLRSRDFSKEQEGFAVLPIVNRQTCLQCVMGSWTRWTLGSVDHHTLAWKRRTLYSGAQPGV